MIHNFNKIKIHNEESFKKMRTAGELASDCLDYITDFIEPGISTDEINNLCHEFQTNAGVSDGEIKRMIIDITQEKHPECNKLFKRSAYKVGDRIICSDRISYSLDKELNKIYKDVMERYSVFPKQKKRIRNVQRDWIKYRNEECVFEDFDGSMISETSCKMDAIAMSIWYLNRLNSIQFDEKGISQIKEVLKEYKRKVNPI